MVFNFLSTHLAEAVAGQDVLHEWDGARCTSRIRRGKTYFTPNETGARCTSRMRRGKMYFTPNETGERCTSRMRRGKMYFTNKTGQDVLHADWDGARYTSRRMRRGQDVLHEWDVQRDWLRAAARTSQKKKKKKKQKKKKKKKKQLLITCPRCWTHDD